MKISEVCVQVASELGSPFPIHADLELQLVPIDAEEQQKLGWVNKSYSVRIPQDAKTEPVDNDRELSFHPDCIRRIGTTGWNWRKRVSERFGFDADSIFGHKKGGLDDEQMRQLLAAADQLPYVTVNRSTSGNGYHLWVALAQPVATTNHTEHAALGMAILEAMKRETGYDFVQHIDVCGQNIWIAARDKGSKAFEIVKQATTPLVTTPSWERPRAGGVAEQADLDAEHDKLVLWLTKRGLGEWDSKEQRLSTHTLSLAKAHAELELNGEFVTNSSGSSERNVFLHPRPKGAWLATRHGKGVKEADTWFATSNGWTCCDFNKKPDKKQRDDQKLIELVEKTDEFFCSDDGRAMVTFSERKKRLTLMVEEEDYADSLRRRFRERFDRPVNDGNVKNAVHNLRAIAKANKKYKVRVRVAGHNGNIYIDLCDDEGQIVEVTADGWKVVKESPVRFRRTKTMDALPVPVPGSIEQLRPFCRVTDADFPLVVGWLVAALRPEGPYTIMSMEGPPGSAKSTMARVCKSLVDPMTCELSSEPSNMEDLMLQAFRSWVVAYDNLSVLDQKMSDALCRVSTGGTFQRRKLYSAEDQTTFTAKNPVLVSSIEGVITARDLIDRSILLTLPVFQPGEKRKSEEAFNAEFMQERPAILGALLDGVSAALKNRGTVQISGAPRMSDFAQWTSAAEPGLGFAPGTIMAAYKAMRIGAANSILDSQLGKAVAAMASAGWQGTATELADALGKPKDEKDRAKKLAGEIRKLAPDLEKLGITVTERTLNGRVQWTFQQSELAKVA